MKRIVLFAIAVTLCITAEAWAGRDVSCNSMNFAWFDAGLGMLQVPDIDVGGDRYDADLGLAAGDEFGLTVQNAAPSVVEGDMVSNGYYMPGAETLLLHCVDVDGTFYWAELGLDSPSPLTFGLTGLGYARDVANSSWAVNVDEGCDGSTDRTANLAINHFLGVDLNGVSGQALMYEDMMNVVLDDGYYSGTFEGGAWQGTFTQGGSSGCFDAQPTATERGLLDGRFQVVVEWRSGEDTVPTRTVGNSDASGLFWFFGQENWEMLVKVLDGCQVNDHFWVFAAGVTDVEYTITVTDSYNDEPWTVAHRQGEASPAITDIQAFATCP